MSKYTDKICPIVYSSSWMGHNCFGEKCAWFSKCYTPTEEVSEDCISIVRCENCIYYNKEELGFRKCIQSGLYVTYDDYCSYGERAENK